MTDDRSTAAKALAAAGSAEAARDIGAIDSASSAANARLAARRGGSTRPGLVERLIFGPPPSPEEFNTESRDNSAEKRKAIVEVALRLLASGQAFTADGKLSRELRASVAMYGAYGITVPTELRGKGLAYTDLARLEEALAANGFGPLAVEISGHLTIGAGSLLGYGTEEQQKLFLPMVAEGRLMGFGLTEVGVGVNAKKIQAYVEWDEVTGSYYLFADGPRAKFYITNATYGALVGIVARIGKGGKEMGLFVVELPRENLDRDGMLFKLSTSGTGAFGENCNSRLEFRNFPIPKQNRIEADGVEVLFYCLRMGRCMLAAMSAGYQRMFAVDALNIAKVRPGVGGLVISHELPQLNLGTMLAGAFQAQALSHLSLVQDSSHEDLAGLRDITKSAASRTARRSLEAAEAVIGGRAFDESSRVHQARHNMHVFGIVEGQDDLITMGMVKDVTGRFTDRYLAPLLSVLAAMNRKSDGTEVEATDRILRITPLTFLKAPGRAFKAVGQLLCKRGFWALQWWILSNLLLDLLRLPLRLIPTSSFSQYQRVPDELRGYARWAEREIRRQRWVNLIMNTFYQLELTKAQLPLVLFGRRLEHLVSLLAVCHHASGKGQGDVRAAVVAAELLMRDAKAIKVVRGIPSIERLRRASTALANSATHGGVHLLHDIKPAPIPQPWQES